MLIITLGKNMSIQRACQKKIKSSSHSAPTSSSEGDRKLKVVLVEHEMIKNDKIPLM